LKRRNWIAIVILALIAGGFISYGIWTGSSYSIGDNWMNSAVEQISIKNFDFASNNSAVVTIQNSGSSTVAMVSAKINGETATLEPNGIQTGIVPKGTSVSFTVTFKTAANFSSGETYQFKLITAKGNTMPYTVTYNPTN
jgi:P pilus assembly chaperone PapD